MGDYLDDANWPSASKAELIATAILASVPEVCLTGCKRVCELRDELTAGLDEWPNATSRGRGSRLGIAEQALCDFHNESLWHPCAEPLQDGTCTQGGVEPLFR